MIEYILFDLDNTLYPSTCGLGLEMSRLMTAFVADYLGVDPQTAESMRREVLDAIDVPASVLTNGPREHAMRVLDRLGIADRFERVFDLRANGFVGKPARSAYLGALDALQIRAESTLFVDDVVEYLLPFRDLGGMIVQVTAADAAAPEIPTIAALRDLVPIIYPKRSRG